MFQAGLWNLCLRQPDDLFPSSLTFVCCKVLGPLLAACEVGACGSEKEIYILLSHSPSPPTGAVLFI